MDRKRWLRVSRHLDEVLDLTDEERAAHLDDLRRRDPDTAADVDAMLAEHRKLTSEGFLESTPPAQPRETPLAGAAIGAYTLVSRIGQGGMGTVWLASRSDGRFEGRVAVKLLNAGLVGHGGEARFTREGTILARLTHPHIARLVDAGVSETGQPYLVLEYVDGRHIDRYCDEQHLDVDARIRLFLDVQAAVAHAHANLIVHRDLKPSNVLVTGAGQVKLLDFSIAKLIGDEDAAVLTRLTHGTGAAMTPRYAAPEQITGGAVTTATDVYALGVLLYELLSGRHPTGPAATSSAALAKAITETEPMRLSAAAPEPLRRMLRGDLETILAKALKKDPAERYASVTEFADDLRRYLDHLPIRARRDSLGYRTAKFVRRHWRGVAGTAVALVALSVTVGFYTVRVATERDRARLQAEKASRLSDLLTTLLTSADPYRTPDVRTPTVQNLLDLGAARIAAELGDQPEVQAEMFTVIGRTYERMGLHAKALPLLEQALAIGRRTFGPNHVRVAQSLNDLGVLQRQLGHPDRAEPLLVESLAMRRRLLGDRHADVAVTLVELARVLRDRGRGADAEAPAREALAIRRHLFGDEHRETATSKNELGMILLERGDLAGAEPLLRENLATSVRVLGEGHPNTAAAKSNVARLLVARGDAAAAEPLLRQALAVSASVFGETHAEYALRLNYLATAIEMQGRLAEADAMYARAVAIARAQFGDAHPQVAMLTLNHARVQIARGRGAAAEPVLRRVLADRQQALAPDDWRIAQAQSLLAASLVAAHRYADAEPLMIAADRHLAAVPGSQGRERAANRARLAALYVATGRRPQADALR
ncbi:MAG TPA: serine/threonine-protein kinase [Vicinamibacterales bacterium]|nr:serine/threonine-protein kinase [Vicinamibacterales bacterium]